MLYSNRSGVFAASASFEFALQDADWAVALDPDWPKGHARRAAALHGLQRFDAALASYDEALRLQPADETLLEARRQVADDQQLAHAIAAEEAMNAEHAAEQAAAAVALAEVPMTTSGAKTGVAAPDISDLSAAELAQPKRNHGALARARAASTRRVSNLPPRPASMSTESAAALAVSAPTAVPAESVATPSESADVPSESTAAAPAKPAVVTVDTSAALNDFAAALMSEPAPVPVPSSQPAATPVDNFAMLNDLAAALSEPAPVPSSAPATVTVDNAAMLNDLAAALSEPAPVPHPPSETSPKPLEL